MSYEIETRCIHGVENSESSHPFGAISVPIYQTATFSHPGIGETTGHNYSRESNPTRDELESLVSSLEGAVDTVACSSGMAALSLCLELFKNGDHIIATQDLYGGSVRIFKAIGEQRNLSFSFVDTTDINEIERNIQKQTKALYIETPSNPTMQITDLRAVKKLADQYGLLIIVDNTFLSPYFQNPILLGADMVVHSGTKFLGGHNDTLAGFLSVNTQELSDRVRFLYKTIGCCLAPFDSFLIARGIKTLAIRMERQQENAITIANWLKKHSKVKKVFYVGLPEHPGHEINANQSRGYGSMISFQTDSPETARKILEKVKIIAFAESLGGVESLITYPMYQTHGDVPIETREKLGITEDFLRISIGIEKVTDLIWDLEQALE